MTYKAHFEQLLLISIQKSNILLEVMKMEVQSDSARYISAQAECAAAEKNYVSFLELMESGNISPNDNIRPLRTAFKIRIMHIMALFSGLDKAPTESARLNYKSKLVL